MENKKNITELNYKKEKCIEEIIQDLMQKEDRKDAEFRFAILTTEVGDIGKYITHDQTLNPCARVHGSKSDEILAYGQVIVQLYALAQLRGIKYEEALKAGLNNWIESDWRKQETISPKDEKVLTQGIVASPGVAYGKAYVVDSENSMKKFKELGEDRILVVNFAKPDFVVALEHVRGLITNHGGYTCHAANICREYGIPCIVGTGDATEKIIHEKRIAISSGQGDFLGAGFVMYDEN